MVEISSKVIKLLDAGFVEQAIDLFAVECPTYVGCRVADEKPVNCTISCMIPNVYDKSTSEFGDRWKPRLTVIKAALENANSYNSPKLSKDLSESFQNAQLCYEPVYDVKMSVMIGSLARLKTAQLSLYQRYADIPDAAFSEDEQKWSDDYYSIIEATCLLKELSKNKFRYIAACTLSYTTLHNEELIEKYYQYCKALPRNIRYMINLQLVDIPDNLPEERLANIIHTLKKVIKNITVVVQVSEFHLLEKINNCGINLVAIDLPAISSDKDFVLFEKMLKVFMYRANKLGFMVFAHGVDSLKQAEKCKENGVRYLTGLAIDSAREMPDPMYRCNWEDLGGAKARLN